MQTSFYSPTLTFDISLIQGVTDFVLYTGDGEAYTNVNPVVHSYTDTGNFEVKLVFFNQRGCGDSAFQVIRIVPPSRLYIPNAFTPNGDGLNDVFEIDGAGWRSFSLQIWNRWGERVYSSTNPSLGWTGKDGNTGAMCPAGVYMYQCIIEYAETGRVLERSGSLTLMR
jgi:gliding motility-associated-like protein